MSSSEARIKILLLEDEAVIREVIHEYLALAGYVVSVAEEGQAALDQCEIGRQVCRPILLMGDCNLVTSLFRCLMLCYFDDPLFTIG